MDSVVYHDSVTDGYRDAVGPLVIGSGLPDPTGEPDGRWLRTASGAAVWVAATASDIPFVPAGTISATDVQAAIEEVASEATAPVASVFGRTGAVLAAASDYDASQVDFTPAGSIVATDVQAAIIEVEAEIPTSLPPSGSASGVLDGSYPGPGLNASVAGAGLAETSDVLSVNVDGTTIEINADALRVKPGVFDAAGAAASAQAASQPLDSDLTAIAALTTTSFGRALLELANSAALLSAAGADAAGAAAAAQAASQPLDSDLTDIAALSPTNDDVVQRKAGAWTNRSMAQVIADLAALGTTFQPLDSDLTAIAALSTTSFGRGLLALADAAALRTSAALGNAATDSYATPTIALGSSAAAGSAASLIHSDATIAAFNATAPSTQAFADAAAVGTAAFAARQDHKHGMMVDPLSVRDARIGIAPLKAGGYWYVPSGTISTQSLIVNQLYVTPYWLPKGLQIDRIGIVVVSNTANSTFNPAIYGDTGNFEPGARLIDGGSLDTHTSNGNKEASISWTVPTNGVYWLGGVCQTAVATMSCFSNVGALANMAMLPYLTGANFPGGNFTTGYLVTGVTGTPPDPFTQSASLALASLVPRMTIRTL